jgi:acyl-CoA thioesterase YciA
MNCEHKCPAIRVVMFPADTNPSGNIFGGVILSHIDIAAGVAAKQVTHHRTVTVCMKEVVFKKPVKVGDILTFWTDILKVGRTSVTIRVKVEAERRGKIIHVTEGEAIFVAVDEQDRPIALDSPLGTQGVDAAETADPASAAAPAPATAPAPAAEAKAEAKGDKKAKKKSKDKDKKKSKKNKK